jgi:hypothetical protein
MTVLLQFIADNAAWVYAACALIALWYLRVVIRAHRERKQAVFALEREAALQRVYNALGVAIALLVTMGATYFISNTLLEAIKPLTKEPLSSTPVIVLPTLTVPGPTPTPEPTLTPPPPTPRPRPTLRPLPSPVLEPTQPPAVVAPNCPNLQARLLSPGENQVISGTVQVFGTANIPNMQYYKLEIRPAGSNGDFSYITGQPGPTDGVLGIWDTTPLPNGAYTLRLVVVDHTGNYPPPCQVTVNVTH